MKRSSVRRVLIGAAVLGPVAGVAPSHAAEVRETDDYVAVIIEAEDFVSRDDRWIPTDATTAPTPETDPDPDGNHSDGASGGSYLEVLPDYRQKHELTVPEGTPLSESLWGKPGTGPSASYAVDFPEPGRYYTHVRAYTTGTEDNGIHIGLNGSWPSSGAALQICTAGARDWRWSNKKRDSGGQSCGIRDTIWLTVEEAGPATVSISAREDGFEIDRMMLIKDRSEGTKNCAPVFNQPDNILCADGGIDAADELVDLDVSLDGSIEEGLVGDRIDLSVTIGNRDRHDIARGVALAVRADAEDWLLVDADEGCERQGGDIVCGIGEVRPAPSDEDERYALTLEARRAGLLRLEASASANETDDTPDNDVETLLVEIDEEAILPTALRVALGGVPGVGEPDEATRVTFSIVNAGGAEALAAELSLSVPDGVELGGTPEGCRVGGTPPTTIDCTVGTLAVAERRTFALSVTPESAGDYAFAARADAANAEESDALASLDVSEPRRPDPVDGGEETPGGSGAGEGEEDERGGSGGGTGGGDDANEEPAEKPVAVTDEDDDDGNGDESGGGAAGPLLALALALVGVGRRRGSIRAVRAG